MRVAIVLSLAVCVSALPFPRSDVSDYSNNGLSKDQDFKGVFTQVEDYLNEQLAGGKVSQEFVNKINQELGGSRENDQDFSIGYGIPNDIPDSNNLQATYPRPTYNREQKLRNVLRYLYQRPYGTNSIIVQNLIQKLEHALFMHELDQILTSPVQVGFGGFGNPYFNPFLTGNPFYGPHIYGGPFMGK